MKVNELYVIIRELKQIIVLQESMLAIMTPDKVLTKESTQLKDGITRLQELLTRYEQYSI